MKLTRTGYGIKALLLLLCFGLQNAVLDAKAIKKSKHAIHKSASKKHDAPKGDFCVNHSYCVKYSDLDCASEWVELNCPRMCRLCEYEGPDIMKLPAVLYYKKGNKKHGISKKGDKKHIITSKKHRKHKIEHTSKVIDKRDNDDGARRDVVFLSRPADYSPTKPPSSLPTTSYSLFDYKSNYRDWLFLYPDQHPVHMRYVDQGKAADPNQQNGAQQQAPAAQDASAAAAAPATGAAEPAVGAAAPAAPGAPPAAPAAPAVAPAAPAAAQAAASPAYAAPEQTAAQTAEPAVAAPAVAAAPSVTAAANPTVSQVGQAAAAQQPATTVTAQQPSTSIAAQQPVAPIAAQQPAVTGATQQPVTAQPEVAANQTIQLINQTVSPSVNATFEPSVANVSQANQTITVGALNLANNTSNQTVASGNITSQNQSQLLVETLSQNTSLSQNSSLSENSSLSQTSSLSQNYSLQNQSETPKFTHNESNSQTTSTANANGTSELRQDKPSHSESLQSSSSASSMPPFHVSEHEVTTENKLHLFNSDESSKMQGHFNPNGASVALSGPGTMDLTTTGQSFTQDVTVDPQAGSDDQSDYSWTCCTKQPRPKDCKKCPDLPKAPPLQYVFNVYCDDLYKDCAYGYSNCNDTWWQIHCPKRCNLCKAHDVQNTMATQTQEIFPNEVKSLSETSKLESDLVAPAPGKKPLVAKYTLRVKPKLLNGVPQTQEIRIMPPNKAGTAGYVKPLMVLKQNITKPMIENIEIDVPQKGAKFSSKPSVEVIEGDHTEMLKVSKGQAIVEDPVQKSKTESEEIKESKPEQDSSAQITADQTQFSTATQASAQKSVSYQPETQTQSSLESQVAQTTIPATQSDSPVAQAEATATQADTTATQADASATQADVSVTQSAASATQSAAFTTTQAAAAPVTPEVPASQTAAYTNTQTCTDDGRCKSYTADRCSDPWLTTNCKSMCKLC